MGDTGGRTWRRRLTRIAVRLAIIYALTVIVVFFIQRRMVYFPSSEIALTPDQVGMAYEDVSLAAADGVKLAAWYVPAARPVGTVLFCHGNGGNISHRIETLILWRRLGLNVLIFDYRGYGQSEGKPTEQGTYLDAEAAWTHLTRQRAVKPGEIIIHGRSLGGAVAAHLARDHTPAGLILESTFTSIPDVGQEKLWFLPVRWLSRFHYATAEYVAGVNCPLLVIHSRDDDLIAFHHGRAVFAAGREPKSFLEIHGSHNSGFVDSEDIYEPALREFVARCLAALRAETRNSKPETRNKSGTQDPNRSGSAGP